MDSNLQAANLVESFSLVGAEDIAISSHSINTINQNHIMRANKLPGNAAAVGSLQ